MEKIEPGKFVEIAYKLYEVAPDGKQTLVHESDKDDPERVIFGVTRGMIPQLEKAIEGLEKGGKFDLVAKAKDAFGEYDTEQIVELAKDIFVVDGKFDSEMVKVGALVPMMTADGFRIDGKVLEVTDGEVKMDFNHPLAGKDVRFEGEVLLVRDATPEELQPAHGCGCGCGHDGCSDDHCGCGDDHHCGEGCGCH
ncbi:MAG TPA: FKBP-type peptidyl-prolyl cis-trans isomerase [Candidatus Amulumruptor caecigallinarius]|uniref:FKBP-type peptidyl-prolyl cis-trans isomerase SlyD n=1 Tax=Candidatus Amulumruptor caecigallinarius TaxID=2109911 RepID=A0A921EA58_9BACT|nr:FKBP-type peptidyl-prolyl cis-trans isomerase [Candidatus Amulumruptor caecigallinarius]